ncbi:MAG: prepilin-type N-terminal cleavage/methylation domain-containing protein [Rubrivivax sp.]|nr:MAG: prepilin-type N-terminal cleavage/methylation domain-containing protein [Rubrivivax sp.]
MRCLSRTEHRQAQLGFTLVELLVAMVILGLVMTLVSQAVAQVAQVARVAQESSQELHSSWNKGWALRGLLANLTAAPEGGDRPFEGEADHISGFTLQPLSGPENGVQPFKLRLASDPATGQPLLIDDLWQGDAGPPKPATVAHFARPVEFAFQDSAGTVYAQWPTPKFDARNVRAPVLPRALLLRDRDSHAVLMWYPFSGDAKRQNPRPKMFWEN